MCKIWHETHTTTITIAMTITLTVTLKCSNVDNCRCTPYDLVSLVPILLLLGLIFDATVAIDTHRFMCYKHIKSRKHSHPFNVINVMSTTTKDYIENAIISVQESMLHPFEVMHVLCLLRMTYFNFPNRSCYGMSMVI